ncbi:hypothetical protein L3049_00080 [Labilibaculum sp. DW002]|uniref:DUF1579 domain-containing protein n=1 Tax=Paralabilibaculum antarcticum TaxID=2912572 RepID=A0ABT5VNP5_9BACT|nr:hypothetical protein [Labilibaculum sp. DW002]MDE5416382.1 hypothetical protein [Labilibaculum sp. DW002]
MKRLLLPIFILLYFVSFSQEAVKSENTESQRQFDFWLGDWEVYANDEIVGKNTVQLLQNGNVLQENWISEKENFTGTSFSFYNSKIKKWQQIWIDKNGSNLLLKGIFADGKMILVSDPDSNMGEENSIHKITWMQLPNGDVKQSWESTIDKGKNWSIQFEGIYKKKK